MTVNARRGPHRVNSLMTEKGFTFDGFLAVFGVPSPLEQPDAAAGASARELLEIVAKLKGSSPRFGDLHIGLAVHYGNVLSGLVGGANRREFTVIGMSSIWHSGWSRQTKRSARAWWSRRRLRKPPVSGSPFPFPNFQCAAAAIRCESAGWHDWLMVES